MQLAGFWRAGRSLVSRSSTADRCVTDQPTAGPLAKASQPLGAETYIVLDLAGPAAAEVRRARRARGYDFYGALPVEVTVAGSSGLGTPAPDQDVRQVFSTLDRIAADTPIITGRFGPMLRFPDTNIFVLTMEDPQPFIDLHQRIGESEIEFLPSPFPFIPHCTVRGQVVGAASSEEAEGLLDLSIDKPFRCEMLSTYTIEAFPLLKLRHRSHLDTASTESSR